MKKVITTEKIPIKLWLDDIEDGALEQAKNMANLPFVFKHVAIMPDAHQGYGMPIGGVLATNNVIIPNAVGVDIGCGMCAVKTSLTSIERSDLQAVVDLIKENIPVGFKHHQKPQDKELMMPESFWNYSSWLEQPGHCLSSDGNKSICGKEYHNALTQIGTLGGGNHFIEIQKGDDGHIWIMIHSGSRNVGLKVADYYNKLAIDWNERWFSQVEKSKQLAFLPMQTQEAKDYFIEMQYCVQFAYANRRLMMERIKGCLAQVIPDTSYLIFNGSELVINIAHNYARIENHFGHNVIIHRKGATSAKNGEIGIIPGSQGTKSYIVMGLCNADSFNSCSHGAGRKMGRKQAQKQLNLEDEIGLMDSQGVIHGMKTVENLDEAAGAYKDIDIVMQNQSDLVKVLVELRPLAVIKG